MEILKLLSHNILISEEKVQEKEIDNDEAREFFNKVINEILIKESKKAYKTVSLTTEVISIIQRGFKDSELQNIPKRLLKCEIEAQKQIDKLGIKVKKGCLLQSYIKKEEKYYFIITKIEASDGLDIDDLKIRNILPNTKQVLKNALFELNEEGGFENIFLSDTNSDISKYWYKDFLELEEMTTDERNTSETFKIIMTEIKKGLKKEAPADYIFCRNQCIGYFKTKENFDLDVAMSEIFLSYTFDNEEIEKEKRKIVEKICKKIDDSNLDTQFILKKEVIKDRKTKFREVLNQGISIEIEGHLNDIKNNIHSQEQDGEKYIIIKATEDAYKLFNWLKDDK
ncbi:hypothetical protein ACO1GZ_07220 [Fusobacterium watanabei]|uniref:hypothetical protein n=1 Tax=Fusobacterium watanabei TaxID=2686067 RepID=UPI003B586D74